MTSYANNRDNLLKYKTGCQKEREFYLERLICDNMGLICKVANKYKTQYIEIDDLKQEATLGFIQAINKYSLDYIESVELTTYAYPFIKRAVLDFIQANGYQVKLSTKRHNIAYKVRMIIENSEKPINAKEIADKLNITEGQVLQALKDIEALKSTKNDFSNIPSEEREKNDVKDILLEEMKRLLNEEQLKVMCMRYAVGGEDAGLSFDEIAKRLGVQRSEVIKIDRQSKDILIRSEKLKQLTGGI